MQCSLAAERILLPGKRGRSYPGINWNPWVSLGVPGFPPPLTGFPLTGFPLTGFPGFSIPDFLFTLRVFRVF